MRKVIVPLVLVALFITGVGLLTRNLQDKKLSLNLRNQSEPTPSNNEIEIEGVKISVEVADTDDERRKGLSGRTSLPENEGLLFVFDKKDVRPTFWMKGMLISIDLIWIDGDKIVQIDANATPPQPNTPDSKLTLYTPAKPVDYVLEVNSGFAEKHNIEVGDTVNLSSISL